MKPDKQQRGKQRWQDLCWKVIDSAQSFVLPSYTMHESRNQHVSIGYSFSERSKQLLYFVQGQDQKTYNKELCRVS